MPSVAKVRATVKGADAFDTEARQSGAFKILRDLVTDLSEGRDVANRLSREEIALRSGYLQASSAATGRAQALLVEQGAPKTGPDSPGPKTFRASEHYHYDPAFKQELLKRFFSASFVASYETAIAARPARASETGASSAGGQGTRQAQGNWLAAGGDLLQSALGTMGLLLTLGAAALLGLSYPLLAFFRSRRVGFRATTGVVTDAKTWTEQDTHTRGGYTDASGQWVPGSSYTTSSRNDEFFIQEGERQHPVSLQNVPLAVARGHEVTAVRLGVTAKAKVWWVCRLRNHTTGQGATVKSACRRVRGSSLATSTWLTFVVFTPACVAAYLVIGGEQGVMALRMIWGTGFSYWFFGGLLIKLVHVLGDRRILARAQRLENPGIT